MKTQIAWAMQHKKGRDIPTEREIDIRHSTFAICKTRKEVRQLRKAQDNSKDWKIIKVKIEEA